MAVALPLLPVPAAAGHSVILFDYENSYLCLHERFFAPPRLHTITRSVVPGLVERLGQAPYHAAVVWQAAYADFERLPPGGAGGLARAGIEPVFVAGGGNHKNAADMRLCVDALELAHTRPDIGTFVLVSGDGDYLPLVQRLRRYGRRVVLVGLREHTAADLTALFSTTDGGFVNALELLPPAVSAALAERRADCLLRHHGVAAFRADGVAPAADAQALDADPAFGLDALDPTAAPDAEEGTAEPRADAAAAVAAPPTALPRGAAPATLQYTPAPPGWAPPPKTVVVWPEAAQDEIEQERAARAARRAATRAAGKALAEAAAQPDSADGATIPAFAPVVAVEGQLPLAALRATVLFTPKTNRKPVSLLLSNLRLQLLVYKLTEAKCDKLVAAMEQHGALVRFRATHEPYYTLNLDHPDVRRFLPAHLR